MAPFAAFLEILWVGAVHPLHEGLGYLDLFFLVRLLDTDEVNERREEVADAVDVQEDLLADILTFQPFLGGGFRSGA